MVWLAREELSAADVAGEFPVAGRDFSSHRDDVGATFDFEAFKGVIIEIHLVSGGGNLPAVIRIVDDKVGIGASYVDTLIR